MKISGFDNLSSIDKFYYKITTNSHEYCWFDISIDEKDIDTYIGRVDSDCNIEDDNFRFCGIVTDICIYRDKYCPHARVTLIGQSRKKLDMEKKTRVFQNPDKKQTEILDKAEMTKSVVSYTADADDNVDSVIVQDNETNWSFLLRLAKMWGLRVFPSEKVTLGKCVNKSVKTVKNEDVLVMKQRYAKNQKRIKCRLSSNLNFGDKVSFGGDEYVVDKIIYTKIHNQFQKIYYFMQYTDEPVSEKSDYFLRAKVTDNEDSEKKSKIQVTFDEPYEDVMSDNPMWIDTETFFATKDTGISFLPEKDDSVIVHICNGKPTVQSVLRSEQISSNMEDYNTKYLFLNNNRYFEFNNDEVKFKTEKCECKITNDNTITIICDQSSIEMEKDKITIKSKDSINIVDSKTISLQTNGSAKVKLENNVDVKGNEIHLN